jgi:hypothetical protein
MFTKQQAVSGYFEKENIHDLAEAWRACGI